MDLVVSEGGSEPIERAIEMVDGKQRGVGDPVRLAAAELVVAYKRAVAAQCFQRFEVVTGVARTSMEQDYGCSVSASRFPVPDPAARHIEVCFSRSKCRDGCRGSRCDHLTSRSVVAGGAGDHAECSETNCDLESDHRLTPIWTACSFFSGPSL